MILAVQGCCWVYVFIPSRGRRRIYYDLPTQSFRKEEKLEVKSAWPPHTACDLGLLREGEPIYSFPQPGRVLPPGVIPLPPL